MSRACVLEQSTHTVPRGVQISWNVRTTVGGAEDNIGLTLQCNAMLQDEGGAQAQAQGQTKYD